MTLPTSNGHRPDATAGGWGSLVLLSLLLVLLCTLMGVMLLFDDDVELKTARADADAGQTLVDTDSALHEVLWRLNLRHLPLAAPTGSLVTVNRLVNYDAAVDYDPLDLLTNANDDDADRVLDELDELLLLHRVRFWSTRILLVQDAPYPPEPVPDSDFWSGPPWGAQRLAATIQPAATWRPYTVADPASAEVLTVRFKLDTDTAVGDAEGDGPEIVFHDPELASNAADDRTSLIGLGGDGNPALDSPYNITWSDGVTTYPASGTPVLLVEAAARVDRGGRSTWRRRIRAEIQRPFHRTLTRGLCSCESLTISGDAAVDSYKSSEGDYGTGPVYPNGHVGSNGSIRFLGSSHVQGEAEAGTTIDFAGSTAHVDQRCLAGVSISAPAQCASTVVPLSPAPQPCACSEINATAMVDAARLSNDNSNLIKLPPNPPIGGSLHLVASQTVIMRGGTYYFDSISLSGSATIQIGVDTNGDGLVDAPPLEPVRLCVAGSVTLGGGGVVNASRPTDFELICSAVPPTNVSLAGDTAFRGVVVAPYTEVRILGSNAIMGAVIARTITNTGGAPVHRDEDLANVLVYMKPHRLLSWHEVN